MSDEQSTEAIRAKFEEAFANINDSPELQQQLRENPEQTLREQGIPERALGELSPVVRHELGMQVTPEAIGGCDFGSCWVTTSHCSCTVSLTIEQ
jgi:hypothetical protein